MLHYSFSKLSRFEINKKLYETEAFDTEIALHYILIKTSNVAHEIVHDTVTRPPESQDQNPQPHMTVDYIILEHTPKHSQTPVLCQP